MISSNPAIFVLDVDAMRQQIRNFGKNENDFGFGFAEELLSKALHPRNFERNLIQYGYNIVTDEYMD
jgi:hypothetical protein